MMNNTYSMIINQSERAWSFQWARTLFALERKLSDKEKSKYLKLYSINMPAPKANCSNNNLVNDHDDTERDEGAGAPNGRQLQVDESSAATTASSTTAPAANTNSTTTTNLDDDVVVVGTKGASGGEDEEKAKRFVPALMIIKRMSFTRAERRRLVLGYWQVSHLRSHLFVMVPGIPKLTC